jgi:hypothetical protein
VESQGVALKIWVKALAIQEPGGKPSVIITVDNCGIPQSFWSEFSRRMSESRHIPVERLALCSSHTHSAPCLSGALPNMFASPIPDAEQATIDRYTRELMKKTVQVASQALDAMQPARLGWSEGEVDFSKNRRTPGGPVFHRMPLLAAQTEDGKWIALLVNYACHCTTLTGESNVIHGDWAGVAQELMEKAHPGAVAMVAIGCGADSNPLPRSSMALVQKYGGEIADEVESLLQKKEFTNLEAPLVCEAKTISLFYQPLPTLEEWRERAKQPGIVGYHASRNVARLEEGQQIPINFLYDIHVWKFGNDLAMVFLPGEVVVDYVLRLRSELDAKRLWVNAYSNYVPCYIPSKRVLAEGGYEAETSLWYYDRPARLRTDTEDQIIQTTKKLAGPAFLPKQSEEAKGK